MRKNFLIVVFILLQFVACKSGIDPETYTSYQNKGDEVTNIAQATLLSNVGAAIQKGGPQYAVEFCNLKASGITDSLSQQYKCNISRISAKNRNPNNKLKTTAELTLWETFSNHPVKDTLLASGGKYIYYKRINTAMPACLKCHGTPEKDIDAATLEKLNLLYPEDLATGYQLNDFRGLWKVEFPKE